MKLNSYTELIAWQKAMDLVTSVYRTTMTFPKEEIYGLTSQMRRSAVSVPSNIAEGQGRLSKNEFKHFLGMSRGSLLELETQILVAQNLGYVDVEETNALISSSNEVGKVINGLIRSLN
jgi:four helix bundle protein